MKVLVINSGSSSLKAQLMDTVSGEVFVLHIAKELVKQILLWRTKQAKST